MPKACNLPIDAGRCMAYFPRWGFDRSSGRCIPFIYGGCKGNQNNFHSIEECESLCLPGAGE
ncbi:KappaPI-actitoxin-Avd3b [Hymenolepis weldensis]